MSRYGIPSRRMLTFLNDNPGATSGEINEHLFDGRTIEQTRVRYRYRGSTGCVSKSLEQWQPKRYVTEHMVKSKWYEDVTILDERVILASKICRGKYSYLLSPYCSRTLSADTEGSRPHPAAANRKCQRMWFYRSKASNGRFQYFLTLRGMAALEEHGV